MEYVLRTHDLVKLFGGKRAVDKISMNIGKGEIYGFLGKNGAGKTTTIRMIMGLIRPTSGSVELFGENVRPGKCSSFSRMGSIVETPGFYPNLTIMDNLEIHRRLMRVANKNYIDEAIEITGIQDVRNKKVQNLSQGMKQRLGLARALLNHPEMLVLDEPTNGLDPMGIKEIRRLIVELSQKRKMTILISSHILSEIEQMATKIGIIHNGKLLEEIDLETLQKKNRHFIEISVSDGKQAAFILEQRLGINDYKIVETGVVRIFEKLNETYVINRMLIEGSVDIKTTTIMNETLEDYFVKLTGGDFNV